MVLGVHILAHQTVMVNIRERALPSVGFQNGLVAKHIIRLMMFSQVRKQHVVS